ncbi:MAG: hypothetical protein ABI419_03235 [Ginsengibacter sp.]
MNASLLYIDPGSGSYLVQMIIAAILGGMFYIKTIWKRIKLFFSKNKDASENEHTDE